MRYGIYVRAYQSLDLLALADMDVIDNIRFAVDVCLYGFPRPPDAISSPCDIGDVCGPLGDALTFDRLRTEDEQGFGYCNAADGTFTDSRVEACYQCLQTSPEQNYLANCTLLPVQAGVV